MHSRYWHAAILFFAAYGFVTGRYALLFISSIAYALNMEAIMRFMENAKHITFTWNPHLNSKLIAGLFTITLLLGIWQVYRQVDLKKYLREIGRIFTFKSQINPVGGDNIMGELI